MQYRREIDGLRAIAVLPVILFHAGFSVFSGGYVGVDVFFVISGYLITSILIIELEQDSFSILRFYERRARRILPALFFVMLACLPFAYMWMLPSQLKSLSQSLVAVVLFCTNILFWRESGYFSAAAELKPLLHTWSLAVEEQYYLIFPVFLLLVWRFGRNRVFLSVVVIAAFSLILSEWGWRNRPSANFYLAPTRAWELLAGSMCAFWTVGKKQRSNNLLSACGLILIVFAIFHYDKNTPFPSVYTLAPVAGTALIILFSDKTTWVGRLLSARAFVGIGLISYSAYLWHQPIFAFARLRSLTEPNLYLMAVLIGATLLLAWATWRLVEQPFRTHANSILIARRSVFAASGAVGAFFITIGLAGNFSDGFKLRGSGELSFIDLDERIIANHGLHSDCDGAFNNSANCHTSETPDILLWGDSFAMHLAHGMLASETNIALQQHTFSACAPVVGMAQIRTRDWAQRCINFNNQVMDWLRAEKSVRTVVLSSPFSMLDAENILIESSGETIEPDEHFIAEALLTTATEIRKAGATVIIVSPTPRNDWNTGDCLARSIYFGADETACDFELNVDTKAHSLLRLVSEKVPTYWLDEDICKDGVCNAMLDGVFIYRDEGHLSKEGSAYLGRVNNWMQAFRMMAN